MKSRNNTGSKASNSTSADDEAFQIAFFSSLAARPSSSNSRSREKNPARDKTTSSQDCELLDTELPSATMLEPHFKQLPKPWLPRNYQKKGLKFLLEHSAAALWLDPSMGKTSITLAAIKFLLKKGIIKKVLVIAPLRPCWLVWLPEVAKWKDFNDLRVEVLHGKDKEAALQREADIYVINPEGLDWLFVVSKRRTPSGKISVSADISRVKRLGFDTLVIDEITKFKNHSSQRYKVMKQVVHLFARRWGLTGSPSANGLINLFAQVYCLDLGRTFGEFFTHFRNKYFYPADPAGFKWLPQPGAEEQIYERVAPLAMRLAADDYLDLPPVFDHDIVVELPPAAYAVYRQVEDDLFARVEDGLLTPANSGAASNKCRQVSSGSAYSDPEFGVPTLSGPRKVVHIHDAKISALEDLVDELQGQPLMIAYEFDHELVKLRAAFPQAGTLVGSTKQVKATEAAWNAGQLEILLVQPQSAAHGLNLQSANCGHLAWLTLTWDQEAYEQLVFRIRRPGTTAKRIMVHRILAKGTIDYVVKGTLSSKDKGQQALFQALKDYAKRRRK